VAGDGGWEQLFQEAFDRSLNPMELLSVSRRLVAVNRALTEAVGRSADELLGTLLEDVLVPEERAEVAAWWGEFVESGEKTGEWTVLCPDGRRWRCPYAGVTREVDDGRRALFVWLTAASGAGGGEEASAARGMLTDREREVVDLVAAGHSTPKIAEMLIVAPSTVKTHVENAMGKLGAKTRAHLVALVLTANRALDGQDAA
jgi:PAS domain S-box-containing protein